MRKSIVIVTVLGLLLAGAARAERFEIQAGSDDNLIVFKSHAPLETFEGKTHRVWGFVELDPGSVGDSITVRVEVDMADLDTGIGLRNKHMRENHLETETYPTSTFTGATILGPVPSSLEPGETVKYVMVGSMNLHGVKRKLRAPVEMTLEEDKGERRLRVTSRFPVKLDHYDISRPKFLMLQVDEVQQVRIELTAVSRSEKADTR
jgi:polyisoprenoid-binding protein YceI